MKFSALISIALFTMTAALTVLSWKEYLSSSRSKEGFQSKDVLSDDVLKMITKANEPVPTDNDAIQAHQTLLRYIRNDYRKGLKFVFDFRDRFFGENVRIRDDLDVRTLLDNYHSPLQRL